MPRNSIVVLLPILANSSDDERIASLINASIPGDQHLARRTKHTPFPLQPHHRPDDTQFDIWECTQADSHGNVWDENARIERWFVCVGRNIVGTWLEWMVVWWDLNYIHVVHGFHVCFTYLCWIFVAGKNAIISFHTLIIIPHTPPITHISCIKVCIIMYLRRPTRYCPYGNLVSTHLSLLPDLQNNKE